MRVDLATGAVTLTEICGLPNGLVANPPVVDEDRRIVGRLRQRATGCSPRSTSPTTARSTPRWRREQNHACHPLLFPDTGELVTNDHDATRMADAIVVLDIETGEERVRVDAGSPVQSVLFPARRVRPRLLLLLVHNCCASCRLTDLVQGVVIRVLEGFVELLHLEQRELFIASSYRRR